MSYVPPFEIVKKTVKFQSVKGKLYVNAEYEEFLDLIKLMLRSVEVDESWYLRAYPDVAQAVESGGCKSAKQHFIESGYFEGRRPSEFRVDDNWYLKAYEDVSNGIKQGEFRSASQHFDTHGYAEGRLPSEY